MVQSSEQSPRRRITAPVAPIRRDRRKKPRPRFGPLCLGLFDASASHLDLRIGIQRPLDRIGQRDSTQRRRPIRLQSVQSTSNWRIHSRRRRVHFRPSRLDASTRLSSACGTGPKQERESTEPLCDIVDLGLLSATRAEGALRQSVCHGLRIHLDGLEAGNHRLQMLENGPTRRNHVHVGQQKRGRRVGRRNVKGSH